MDRLSTDPLTDPQKSELGFIDGQYFTVDYNINPLVKSRIDFKFKKNFNQFVEQNSSELKSFESFTRQVNPNISEDKDFDQFNDFEDNSVLEKLEFESPLKTDLFSKNFELNIETKENKNQNLTEDQIKDKIKEQMEITLEEEDKPIDRYKKPQRTGAQYLKDLQKGKESPKYPKLFTEEVKEFRASFDQKGEKLDSKG